MDPLELEITIARPRDEVFAYLVDIANHPEFCDHYLVDWRLTRVNSVGEGAGARFKLLAPRVMRRFAWGDLNFAEVEAPRRIVGFGRGGKYNRIKTTSEWLLEPAGAGSTRVQWFVETEPAVATDRINEALGFRGFMKRRSNKALRRLRAILEEDDQRGKRATVGGL